MTAKPIFFAIRIFYLTIISLGILITVSTTDSLKASNLIDNSPFVPDEFSADYSQLITAPGKSNLALSRILEFRGFYSLAGKYYFNIFNHIEENSHWVKMRESEAPYQVLRFEKNKSLIFIKFNGRTEKLTLVRPSHDPLPVITTHRKETLHSTGKNKTASSIDKSNIVENTSPLRRRVITPEK